MVLIGLLAMAFIFWFIIWLASWCDQNGRHFPTDSNRGGWSKK